MLYAGVPCNTGCNVKIKYSQSGKISAQKNHAITGYGTSVLAFNFVLYQFVRVLFFHRDNGGNVPFDITDRIPVLPMGSSGPVAEKVHTICYQDAI